MPRFYDYDPEPEILIFEEEFDAIACYLDDQDILPLKLKIYGFDKVRIDKKNVNIDILSPILESLDEEYGDPSNFSEPTPRMLEAVEELKKVILEEYEPWLCEQVSEKEIDVKQWIKENGRMEWYKNSKFEDEIKNE